MTIAFMCIRAAEQQRIDLFEQASSFELDVH
jgi:hypothetical protein